MNPIELIKLAGKLKWVGELADKAHKYVEVEKYKALIGDIISLGDQLRQKIDELVALIREDGKELDLLASLPAEESDIGVA